MTKQAVSYAAFAAMSPWQRAFERVKARGKNAAITVDGTKYRLAQINEDPAWVWVSFRHDGKIIKRMVKVGDPLMIELARKS